MVEPVTAVLSGIALVRSATSFIKENINTCQDISGIAKQIDQLFTGQQEIEKQRIKDQNNNITEQLGISSVAQSVIDAKLAAEQLNEIRTLVNYRFGPNTWAEILAERKKRIDQVREAKRKIVAQKIKRRKETIQVVQQASIGFGLVFLILFFCIIAYVALSKEVLECMEFKPKYYMICMNEGKEMALTEQYLDELRYRQENIIIQDKEKVWH
tara:strand:- start:2126 stop:2764 length:639 start_codon:yes stop_codon:yes gene_type:complete